MFEGDRVKVGRVYQHFKGDKYLLEEVAEHSEMGEKMVIYRALYGEGTCTCALWKCLLVKWTIKNIRM